MLEMWRKLSGLVVVTALIGEVSVAHTAPLDAIASNPNKMGWMQGFPPAEDRIIGHPSTDYFSFPKLRWTFCHFRGNTGNEACWARCGAHLPILQSAGPRD